MKSMLNPFKKAKTKVATTLLSGLVTLQVHAQPGIPTVSGPGGASGEDPFNLLQEMIKWGITIVGYGICALIFLTVVKNLWAKYNDMGEENSRTTWREVLVHGIAGMTIVIIGVLFTNMALEVFGTADI